MKLETRYEGTAFSREDVDQIQDMLGLADHSEALESARIITSALKRCAAHDERRR